MHKAILLIFCCAIINYSLRSIPLFLRPKREMPPYLQRFLAYMPIAALGTLIFPGIFTSFPGKPLAGAAGVTAAALCAWFARGLVLPVFASIIATWLVLQYVYAPPAKMNPTEITFLWQRITTPAAHGFADGHENGVRHQPGDFSMTI